jgi:hypothetical protein
MVSRQCPIVYLIITEYPIKLPCRIPSVAGCSPRSVRMLHIPPPLYFPHQSLHIYVVLRFGMAASYVSLYFEKTDLWTQLGQQRCIVRNLDDGPVPPLPGPGYYPTEPDSLRECFVGQYIDDTLGERLLRAATLADIGSYAYLPLTTFESVGAGFLGVFPGDVLTVTIPVVAEWQSGEYPSAVFSFSITGSLSDDALTVLVPFPSFKSGISWEVPSRGLSGTLNGTTRRTGSPAPGTIFRDRRFNTLWPSVPQLDAFVAATKAQIDALGQTSTSSNLTSESYTSRPLIG